jgi:hypothetical protein
MKPRANCTLGLFNIAYSSRFCKKKIKKIVTLQLRGVRGLEGVDGHVR